MGCRWKVSISIAIQRLDKSLSGRRRAMVTIPLTHGYESSDRLWYNGILLVSCAFNMQDLGSLPDKLQGPTAMRLKEKDA
jgi:hypothetical protein